MDDRESVGKQSKASAGPNLSSALGLLSYIPLNALGIYADCHKHRDGGTLQPRRQLLRPRQF